jgi:hypothetical protein
LFFAAACAPKYLAAAGPKVPINVPNMMQI